MSRIRIIQQDITNLAVDAVVNAANNSLLGGGGVDGAIHAAAGSGLFAACKALGGCATGGAKLTAAYQLPAKYIIHTVGPVWTGGQKNEPELLASCYRHCMEIALQLRLQSIAFPAISCGVYHFPVKAAANIAITTVLNHLRNNQHLQQVYLVCFEEAVNAAYNEIFQQLRVEQNAG